MFSFRSTFFWRVPNLKSQKLVPKKIIPNKLYISCAYLLSATLAASGSSAVSLPGNGKKLNDSSISSQLYLHWIAFSSHKLDRIATVNEYGREFDPVYASCVMGM